MSSVTWAPKHRPGFINKNEVYCFFYRDFAAQFEHEFCKKKKNKTKQTLWYKAKRSQVRRNTMVFFRSYDRLSHKYARRGITGLHVDSCIKKTWSLFYACQVFFMHESTWRPVSCDFVRVLGRVYMAISWRCHRGRSNLLFNTMPCCVYRKRHISIYPPLR